MANPSGALWNWCIDGRVAPVDVYTALAAILTRPVVPLAVAARRPTGPVVSPSTDLVAYLPDHPTDTLLCDVWHTDGDFPTRVDCYLAPVEPAEPAVAASLACRLNHSCLVPDDTFDPGRFLLAAPDGTLRPVHLDVDDGEDGPVLSRLRPCTAADQRATDRIVCRQSRWAPGSVVVGAAAGRTAA